MAELRLAGQTNGQGDNVMETGTGILGRVQGCSLVLWEWVQKDQRVEPDRGCKE